MIRLLPVLGLGLSLASCLVPVSPVRHGMLDLRHLDWSKGPVSLQGEWAFGSGWRTIPDQWTGSEGGGLDGRGSGTYRLTILLPENGPPLALRYATASTAFAVRVDNTELVRVGTPDADPRSTVPAFAPGTVRIPSATPVNLEIFVSNNVYRVGGLWSAPLLGPASSLEQSSWWDQAAALSLATSLTVIALISLLFYAFRRSEAAFLPLGLFALLVGLRPLVTGEYTLVRIVPGLPFEVLIRLEYLTAFLPLPLAIGFFESIFPKIWNSGVRSFLVWPSCVFAVLALLLPLDLLTRSIRFYYPIAVTAMAVALVFLAGRIRRERRRWGLAAGIGILTVTALSDMISAAFFAKSGSLIPWGLGLFVVLQTTALTQRLLESFRRNEALLTEKELLIKEVHHRVKNSLQVVASLVSLQSNRTTDQGQKAVFRALRQRITAIALIHEKLYGREIGRQPDLREYLLDLIRLQYPGDGLGLRVAWEIHMAALEASIDDCIDTGLILTELVSNAHKHGLLPRGGGRISVDLEVLDGRMVLEVVDDGPGFLSGYQPEASTGLGFRLIQALMQRHDGFLTVVPGDGGRVRVDLKAPSQPA
jgi:two-component sensor histidine kinase